MYDMFNGAARGPLFGPNFVEVVYDTDGASQTVQIYPDICNDDLRNSGNPMSFYIHSEKRFGWLKTTKEIICSVS